MKDHRGLYPSSAIIHSAPSSSGSKRCRKSNDISVPEARWFKVFASIVALGICLSAVLPAFGQSTFGSIRGIAQDASGAAIPDTKVVLHSADENTDRATNADSSGGFIFENVKAGHYTLHASHDGFADTVVSAISVEARQDLRLTVSLDRKSAV